MVSINSSGNQLYCSDIGTSASCYDRDIAQREGWERCLKTCGNCADTQITRMHYESFSLCFQVTPMKRLVLYWVLTLLENMLLKI